LGSSRGGFPLPSSRFVIRNCNQFSFSLALFVRGTLQCYPLVNSRGLSPIRNPGTQMVAIVPQPSANLSHQQTPPPLTNEGQIWFAKADPRSTLICQTLPQSVYFVALWWQKKPYFAVFGLWHFMVLLFGVDLRKLFTVHNNKPLLILR